MLPLGVIQRMNIDAQHFIDERSGDEIQLGPISRDKIANLEDGDWLFKSVKILMRGWRSSSTMLWKTVSTFGTARGGAIKDTFFLNRRDLLKTIA